MWLKKVSTHALLRGPLPQENFKIEMRFQANPTVQIGCKMILSCYVFDSLPNYFEIGDKDKYM
jgi:hypothetical protein